jgi:hypothetical protein
MEEILPLVTADVFGNEEFKVVYFPSRLSKPMLERVQALADDPKWEVKADSNTTFLLELIDSWTWAKADPTDPTGIKLLVENGQVQMEEVNAENLSRLGFAIQKKIAKAINVSYGEFMSEGEESGVSSEEPSQAGKEPISIGTPIMSPLTETGVAPGN